MTRERTRRTSRIATMVLIVLECSGKVNNRDAAAHLVAGAKKVLVSRRAKMLTRR